MRFFYTFFFILTCSWAVIGQKLPTQWRFSYDERYLIAGNQDSGGIYDESNVKEIRLYFSQPDYWAKLTQNYNSNIEIPCRLKYNGVDYDSVGISFKGQTSYFSNNTPKKSFNISMDAFKGNQKLEGYKTLNLNNAFQDPSFMREVLYYRLIRTHSQSAKANFVRVYINDEDWGIYLNVQQLNKDFLEEWYESNDGINIRADRPDGTSAGPGGPGGQWGDGTAGFNYLGTDTSQYKKYYTLKSSDTPNPWQELVKACNILNNSGTNLETEAPKVLDIDKILWHLASEIAFTDDDSYVFKGKMDYYLYMDAETKRWTSYDYDANSTFSTQKITQWSPFYNETKVNYPLLNKLLAVPAFRQRYLAHMRTIISELMDESKVNSIIDSYANLIRSAVIADTKKVTSETSFNNAIFSLKDFIARRKNYLLSNSEVKAAAPLISDTKFKVNNVDWAIVTSQNDVVVTTNVSFAAGINKVVLYYGQGFSGVFNTISMLDNGQGNDAKSSAGIFTATLPKFQAGTMIKFYIEATGNDNAKSKTFFPSGAEHQLMVYQVAAIQNNQKSVVINEFMASNDGIVKDEVGEAEDWIELFNITDKDINMSGYYITDNPLNLKKFKFPANTIIKAKSYAIVWADEDQEQGPLHTNFKLSASGEVIYLLDSNLVMLDSITFGPQITNKSAARIPNGTGNFVSGNHTFGTNNDGTSSTEDFISSGLNVFPNPASPGFVTVSNLSNYVENISIYNLSGIKVNAHIVEAHSEISIELTTPGIYIVHFGKLSKKLIVTH
jgi:spore coat protein CotH